MLKYTFFYIYIYKRSRKGYLQQHTVHLGQRTVLLSRKNLTGLFLVTSFKFSRISHDFNLSLQCIKSPLLSFSFLLFEDKYRKL